MTRSPRSASVLAFMAIILCVANADAQYLPGQDIPTPELNANDDARDAIRESLQQPDVDSNDGSAGRPLDANEPEPRQSGDPILDDVLEVIRRRGSVLQGSVLDPQNETESVIIGVPSLDSRDAAANKGDAAEAAAVYHVAEQMLRVARLLEKLPNQDAERAGMIRGMRNQATRLLIQTLSREAIAPTPAENRIR
jgi:hypothetical protein